MKALITGANGQLGRSLQVTAPSDFEILALGSAELNISDEVAVDAVVNRETPTLIFNAAAYTAVDKAEADEAMAFAVNASAVGYLAAAAKRVGARLVHVSTDFVFDGEAGSPYRTNANTNPLGVYGRTKLAGERAAGEALTVRTGWVYAPTGNNFVRTMLRLMAERPEVRVVTDQIGTPTYAPDLARALWALVQRGAEGIHHYSDAGVASWYDFAVAIQEEALAIGLLDAAVPVVPVTTSDFPTTAKRPSYSVLDKSQTYAVLDEPAPHWRVNLRNMLNEIKNHG